RPVPEPRGDLYSLGCCLCHALTGWRPTDSSAVPPLEELRSDVPPRLAAVVRRLTAPQAAQRYQDASQVAEVLEPFVERLPARRTVCDSRTGTVVDVRTEKTAPLLALKKPRVVAAQAGKTWQHQTVLGYLAAAAGLGLATAVLLHLVQ